MSNFRNNYIFKIKYPNNNTNNFIKEFKNKNNILTQSTSQNNNINLNLNISNKNDININTLHSLKNFNNKLSLNNQKYFQNEEFEYLKNNIIELNEQIKKRDNIIYSLEQKLNSFNQEKSKSLPDRELNKTNTKNNNENNQNKFKEEKESIYIKKNNIFSNNFQSKNDTNNIIKSTDDITKTNYSSINILPYSNLIEQKKKIMFQTINKDLYKHNENNIGDKDTIINHFKHFNRQFKNNIISNKKNRKSPIQKNNKEIILENNNNNLKNKNLLLETVPYNYYRKEIDKITEKKNNTIKINYTDSNIYYKNNDNLNIFKKNDNKKQNEEYEYKVLTEQAIKDNKNENIITNDIKCIKNKILQKKNNIYSHSLNKHNEKKILLNTITQISQKNNNINKRFNIINMNNNHINNNTLNQNKSNNTNSYSNSISIKKTKIQDNKKLNLNDEKMKNLKQNVKQVIKNNISNKTKFNSKKDNKLNNIISSNESKAKNPNINLIPNNDNIIFNKVKKSISPIKSKNIEIKKQNDNNSDNKVILIQQKQINEHNFNKNIIKNDLIQQNSNGKNKEQNLHKSLNEYDENDNKNECNSFNVFKSVEIGNKQIIKNLNENIKENDIKKLKNNNIEENITEKKPIKNNEIILSNNNNEKKIHFPIIEQKENNNLNQNLSPIKSEKSFHSLNISENINYINETIKKNDDSFQNHIKLESKSELSNYEEESSNLVNTVYNNDQDLEIQKEIKVQNIEHQINKENNNNLIGKNDKEKKISNNNSSSNSKNQSNNSSINKSNNNNNFNNIESLILNSNIIDSNFKKKKHFDEPRASIIKNVETKLSEFMSEKTLNEIQLAVNDLESPKNFGNLNIIKEKYIKFQTPEILELDEEIKNFKLNNKMNFDYKNFENKEIQNSTNFNSEKNKNISIGKKLNDKIINEKINDMKKNNIFFLEKKYFNTKVSSVTKNKNKKNKSLEQNKLSKSFDGYCKYILDDNQFNSNNKNFTIGFTKQKKLSESRDFRYNIQFNNNERQKCFSISNINDLLSNKILFSIFDEKRIVSFNTITKTFSIDEFIDDIQNKFKLNYIQVGSLLLNTNNCLYIITGNNYNMFYKYNPYLNHMKFIGKLNYNHYYGGLIINSKKEIFCLTGNFNKKIEKYDNKLNIWINNKEEMNFERSESSFIFINDKYIFSFFGYNSIQNKYLNSIEYCDVSNDNMKWNLIPKIINQNKLCIDIIGHTIIKNKNNDILIFGGYNGRNNKANNLFIEVIFDLENNKIILDKSKENFKLIPNNKIYNFSYYNQNNFMNNIHELYLFDRKNNIILFNIDKNKMDIFYLD